MNAEKKLKADKKPKINIESNVHIKYRNKYRKQDSKTNLSGAKARESLFKSCELKEIVYSAVGLSVLVGGTVLVTPNFPVVFGVVLKLVREIKGETVPKSKVKRVLRSMQKKKILDIDYQGDEVIVKIKNMYDTDVIRYSVKELLALKKKRKWRGKWTLVMFDVPEKERVKRTALRNMLVSVGFYSYQKSVYVFPYECKREVELLKKILDGKSYIRYIVAEKIEGEARLKQHFGL